MRFRKNEAWSFGVPHKTKLKPIISPGPGDYASDLILGKSNPKWV